MNIRRPDMTPNKTAMNEQDIGKRITNFDEVALGYTEEQAKKEAERCMNCPERYCAAHCPAHTHIPEFIAEIRAGNFEAAYQLIVRTNPMLGISGRVCPQECQCESHCTRGIRSEPVAIGRLERFVSDWHHTHVKDKKTYAPRKDKKIAVIGSGPAGITCALSLAKAGFKVTVFEKDTKPGGILSWGIPSFILPRNLVEEQFGILDAYSVKVKTNMALGIDFSLAELRKDYDAVFVGTGAGTPVELDLEGADLHGVVQAVNYLTSEIKPDCKKVVVIGGGNTAIDTARCALRSGADTVKLIYRRTEAEMPATPYEIKLAKEEGVELIPLACPIRFLAENDTLCAIECGKMTLTAPDYPGGRSNTAPNGETFVAEADLAVLAVGFKNKPVGELAMDSQNRIIVDDEFQTSMDGVYAGGDAVTGSATLMKAAAAGKDAAAAIFKRFS